MPLSDGDPAHNGDVWFRVVTDQKHARGGRAHHGIFSGSAIAPPREPRPWAREMSGRLRSLAGSIDEVIAQGQAFCAELTKLNQGKKEFVGVTYADVRTLSSVFKEKTKTGVYYTPKNTDGAHADFTFDVWDEFYDSKEGREQLSLWLTDLLKVLWHPGQLEHFPEAKSDPSL